MKTIWIVLKKEILNILRNRRRLVIMALFNLVILPGMTIAPMLMITRQGLQDAIQKIEVPVQGMRHAPALIAYIEENETMTIVEVEDVEQMVREKRAEAGLIIPADFEQRLQNGESVSVTVVMDKSKSTAVGALRLKSVVENYNQSVLQQRLKESGIPQEYLAPIQVAELNTATAQETLGSQLGLLLPGAILSFGLTSGLASAISSIAGEKESQTLEPVLFTAINRTHLVFGKLLAVVTNVIFTALAFLFSILFSGFLALISFFYFLRDLEIPMIPSVSVPAAAGPFSFLEAGLALPDPLAILLVIISTIPIILLGAALQILISSIARNSEEAFTYSLPLSIFSLAPLLAAFFLDTFTASLAHYAIPVLGTILSMRDLFSNHIHADSFAVMFSTSIAYAALAIWISVWMFNREEVVFRA